ncbi:AraC family transcriptional regulator [Lichenifustis flavocetrariae]|uniref:AraC family transcriptional regulator n=1 Tax=Lichenifustis flavocetrariae TaxID=2949735 RepID=A0AA41YY19_9HYPH|nr:AraC family transcriptional regulator [Lichenifustis flavocetrariae]MCW6509405.1 AraC family transcriptional regulator [Lichenifustis flavocetrariae]
MSTALAVRHGQFGRAALYQLNKAFLMHAHREAHLTFYVRGKSARITVSELPIGLDDLTGVAVDPWQPHSYDPGDAYESTVALVLYLKPQWTSDEGVGGRGGLRFGRSTLEMTPGLHRLVDRIVALLLGEGASGGFDRHLCDLACACYEQSWEDRRAPTAADRSSLYRDFRIRNSIRLMQARIADELAIDTIARDAGLSRPHFYKLFRQHVGLTPNIYLNTLRMEAAIDRLTGTADPVTVIGLDLGFASQASFTRFFTTNVGVPPSDYRRVACRLA